MGMAGKVFGAIGSIAAAGFVGKKVAGGYVRAVGGMDAFNFPSRGMGLFQTGAGFNTVYKKPGNEMPANNIGATGDLTMALHTNRHGYGR